MSFIKFPLFTSRKKKVEIFEAMIDSIKKSGKKKKCDICKRKFMENDSRWSKDDFTSSICILCHKKYFNRKISDYMSWEQKEIRRLKKFGSLPKRLKK